MEFYLQEGIFWKIIRGDPVFHVFGLKHQNTPHPLYVNPKHTYQNSWYITLLSIYRALNRTFIAWIDHKYLGQSKKQVYIMNIISVLVYHHTGKDKYLPNNSLNVKLRMFKISDLILIEKSER